jgi:glutamate synthase domain-containing protein 1
VCGIVGLACRTQRYQEVLGKLFVPMLEALTTRGPDSAGLAFYGGGTDAGSLKYSFRAPREGWPWDETATALRKATGASVEVNRRGPDVVIVTEIPDWEMRAALGAIAPELAIFGSGRAMEVFKGTGDASAICRRYHIADMTGYQVVGHTRMATESAVTIAHSHPFCPAPDVAVVHNGSFSNYATIRRELEDEGIFCETDNDSEVAARFLCAETSTGASLVEALALLLKRFDGFFTLLATTETEFAVLRDSFGCKPMVVAETVDYVAVASEFVALAELPGIEDARVFEPVPEEIYSWTASL